jgi:hypothetical protein
MNATVTIRTAWQLEQSFLYQNATPEQHVAACEAAEAAIAVAIEQAAELGYTDIVEKLKYERAQASYQRSFYRDVIRINAEAARVA